jgi:ferric-dicitrate binding protein FerR (iron transport regulator)
MALLANDAVETGYTYVEIDLVVGGRVWLDVNTRVQVGSIFLFLGRLFASGAPPFRVETEDVTASPEGTNFGVRRSRTSGDWAVAVQTGRVRCTGKRLRFQSDVLAGQILVVAGPLTVPPRPALGDLQREIGWATRAMRRQKPLPPIQ